MNASAAVQERSGLEPLPREPAVVTAEAEAKYEVQRWRSDARLMRYAAVVALILHPLGGLTDYAIIGADPRLAPLLVFRLLAAAVHVPILLACRKPDMPRHIEPLVAGAFVLGALAGVLMPTALRPTSVASQGGPLLLIIVLYALVFPAWRRYVVTTFVVTSAVYIGIGLYWRGQINYGGSHELITMSLFLVAIGTLIPRVTRRIEHSEFERFMAQAELSEMVDRLQAEVRLRERRERALESARNEAEEASLAKTGFMANVSHELRTPLVGILGAAELMRASPETQRGELREGLELLSRSGDLMLELVNDLLDYFKLEAGKLSLRRAPVSLREVAKATVELVRPRIDAQQIELTLEVDDALPDWVIGDPVRLQQLLLNLTSNAAKFTDEGGVTLTLGVVAGAGPSRVAIEVRDTGIGMDSAFIERMFEPFEQAEQTHNRPAGSGLGLAITQHIVTQMGGGIEVESTLGEGTTVRVVLPLEPTQEGERAEQVEPQREQDEAGLSSLRVLIGEDNPVNAMILVRILRNLGHDVTHAINGQVLVDLARAEEFDIVITDGHMPELDGVEATRRLRAMEPPRDAIPILALTADAFEEEHAVLRAAGIDEVLVKPIASDKLAEALARHTHWANPRAAAGGSA